MGIKISDGNPDYRTADGSGADSDGDTPPTCPKRDAIVEQVTGGFGEAVYVAGWNADGFVSAIAETDAEREIAAGVLNGAEAGLAVFVSGPATKCDHFAVGATRAKNDSRKRLLEAAADDTFSRLAEVDMPRMPIPTMMDTECRTVTAAHQAVQEASKPTNPLEAMFGGR